MNYQQISDSHYEILIQECHYILMGMTMRKIKNLPILSRMIVMKKRRTFSNIILLNDFGKYDALIRNSILLS